MIKYDFSKALMLLDKANEQAKVILEEVCQVVFDLKKKVKRNEQ